MGYWESLGKSDEWYTPKYIFDALGCRFDLDVASPAAPTFVPCSAVLTAAALTTNWHGFVWMNPPYGGRNSIAAWLHVFFQHGDGVALVPDRTSAPWFQKYVLYASSVLFVRGKIKFYRPDGSQGKAPGNGSALFAAGPRGDAAVRRAAQAGLGCLCTFER